MALKECCRRRLARSDQKENMLPVMASLLSATGACQPKLSLVMSEITYSQGDLEKWIGLVANLVCFDLKFATELGADLDTKSVFSFA